VVDGFGDAVEALQAVGVHVMPYVNGHLWDTDTRSWADENASEGACLDVNGDFYFEHWQQQDHCARSQLGSRTNMAVAASTSTRSAPPARVCVSPRATVTRPVAGASGVGDTIRCLPGCARPHRPLTPTSS